MTIGGKRNIVFSFSRDGSQPSVVIYSIEDNRDIVQISGANMFLHQYKNDQEVDASSDIENLILLAVP